MKVVILAGGWGSRLGNLTESVPKPMLQIGHKPLLWHIMKFYAHYGFIDFIIALGVKNQVIKNYFLNFSSFNCDFTINLKENKIDILNPIKENWNISLIDTGLQTLKASRLRKLKSYLDEGTNLLTYGDGVSDVNLNELIRFHKNHGKLLSITGVFPPSRFGEIIEVDGLIKSFSEKPQTSVGLINGGFMVFEKKILDLIPDDKDYDLEHNLISDLVKQEEVMVYKHEGNWECMDNPRDYEYLNSLWTNKKAFWKIW